MRKSLYILVASIILLLPALNANSKVAFKDVTTTGIGQSLEEAVQNSLNEAITMVNGKNVYTKTVIKVLGGESVPEDNDDVEEAKSYLMEKFDQLKAAVKQEKQNESKSDEPIKVDINVKKPKREKYSQEYVKEMIDEVKGGVKSYEILEKRIDEKGWHHVTVRSKIAHFQIPVEAQRTRIAIVPFRFYQEKNVASISLDKFRSIVGIKNDDRVLKSNAKLFKLSDADEDRLLRLMSQGLSNYLVKTRKFTILDREYVKEIADEHLNISEGRAPIEELAKLGNQISGDFIFVGSIEEFSVEDKVTKILTSDKEIVRKQASFYLSFRVLDVATKQILTSNFIKIYHTTKTDRPIEIITKMTEKASKIIGEELLFSIYPLIVEKYSKGELYLAQGGSLVKKGDSYEVFAKGEKIVDSYTNEVIGNVEDYLGKVEITSVTSNYSKARFTEGEFDMAQGFMAGQYIVRPVKYDEEAAKLEEYKKAKEKIQKQREKRKKVLAVKRKKRDEKMKKRQQERDKLRKSREANFDDEF